MLLVDWNYKGKGRACCIQASKFRCGRCLLIVLCLIFTVYCLPPLFIEWDLNPMFTLRASSHNVPACLRAACISWHFCFLFSGWFLFNIVPIICLPLCVRACGLHLLALLQTTRGNRKEAENIRRHLNIQSGNLRPMDKRRKYFDNLTNKGKSIDIRSH